MGKQPGGYYPLNYGVIAPGDHWILIRCAAHRPYERSEITPAVIQWHSLRRGGYQPPANVTNL